MSDMLPDMFIDAEMERVREEKRKEEKRREEERRSKKRKSQKKEGPGPGARKGRKVAKRCVFPMICGSRGSKSRLAKAAGAGPCGQMRDEKLHAVVAQSTFPIQNVTMHISFGTFLKLGCRKKCISLWHEAPFQVQMYKTQQPRSLLEVEMFKKCTPLWRRSNMSKSKVQKIEEVRSTFGRSDVVPRGRRNGLCTLSKVSKA